MTNSGHIQGGGGEQQLVTPMPARRPRQLSDIAAQAAQNVHDLEMALDAAHADIHALTARLAVADERARVIKDENEFLMRDRDYHKERCVKIETHLNSAAHMILEAMAVPTKQAEPPPAISLADISEPIESAVAHAAVEPKTNGNGKKNKTPPPDAAVQT